MRKLIIISLAILLASCNKIDIPDGGISIDFQGAVTRAAVSDIDDIARSGGFGVYAQQSTTSEATTFADILTNEKVYKNGNDWVYDNKCYWAKDRTFNFFGIYPYVTNNDNITVTSATHRQNGVNYNGYKIGFVLPEQTDMDLMTASKVIAIGAEQTVYETVILNFNHDLAKININVAKNSKNENDQVIITAISMSGIWKSGTLNTAFSPDYENNWDFTGATTTSIIKSGQWLLGTSNTPILTDLILMPQDIGAQKIPIYIEYTFTNREGSHTSTVTAYIPIGKWDATKNYTYNIILAAEDDEIRISTPIVETWGAYQSGGTIVIQ